LTTHNTHKRQKLIYSVCFEPTTPSKQAVTDPRLRHRGHWDRLVSYIVIPSSDSQEADITGPPKYSKRE
jgi:hypothetical protein